jgi:hypothetical protein
MVKSIGIENVRLQNLAPGWFHSDSDIIVWLNPSESEPSHKNFNDPLTAKKTRALVAAVRLNSAHECYPKRDR